MKIIGISARKSPPATVESARFDLRIKPSHTGCQAKRLANPELKAKRNMQGRSDLFLNSVTNIRQGTDFLDANGFVHFIHKRNHFGCENRVCYRRKAANEERLAWVA